MLGQSLHVHEGYPAAHKLKAMVARLPASPWLRHAAQLGLVGLTALLGTWLVYATGGTNQAYPHIMYLPVLLGAYFYGVWGGLVTGAACGLGIGPWMPLDVAAGTAQPAVGWLSRSAFFIGAGGLGGALMRINQRRLNRNEALMRELSEGYGRILRTFSSLVSMRDDQTKGHCDRVALNAVAIGQDLRLGDSELRNLYWAGILHDLGKVALPAAILLKPGPLTEEEYRQVQEHVTYGADLLDAAASTFADIAAGVRSHHERWDGSGYPQGLRGQEIPLSGRVLAVADVFEALTSERPYRGPMETQEAVEYLRDRAGTEFDPAVVEIFLRLYQQEMILVGSVPGETGYRELPMIPGRAA